MKLDKCKRRGVLQAPGKRSAITRHSADKKRVYVRIDDEIEVCEARGQSYHGREPLTDDDACSVDEYATTVEDHDGVMALMLRLIKMHNVKVIVLMCN